MPLCVVSVAVFLLPCVEQPQTYSVLFYFYEKWRNHTSRAGGNFYRLWALLCGISNCGWTSLPFLFPFKRPVLLPEIQSNFIAFTQNWSIATGEQVNYNRRINAEVSKFSTLQCFQTPQGPCQEVLIDPSEQVWQFEAGADNWIWFGTIQLFLICSFPYRMKSVISDKKAHALSCDMAGYILLW